MAKMAAPSTGAFGSVDFPGCWMGRMTVAAGARALTVRSVKNRGPIDGHYPAVFFLREGHDPIGQQFIQLALVVQVIRIKRDDQPLAQLDLLLRQVFHGSVA